MIDDKQIIITDEDGTENKYEILFTFVGDDSDVQYVLYFDPENPEEIFASRYYDDGHLEDIDSEEEWEMVEEVLNTFQDDEEAQEHFGLNQ